MKGAHNRSLAYAALFLLSLMPAALCDSTSTLFEQAKQAYRGGDYSNAASLFREAAGGRPASGTLLNLGNAEWQSGHPGPAVLAWEQARWLDPFNGSARDNLRFARRAAQLEAPELPWYEVVSTWLPVNWWAWIAGVSFWFAMGIATLPALLRIRKTVSQQASAALALAIFLLSVPAHFGVNSRARIGFVLTRNAPLRLTPTEDAQYVTRLPSGEPARVERVRGRFLLIRTNRASGWIERNEFGLICPLWKRLDSMSSVAEGHQATQAEPAKSNQPATTGG
jgi:tetratricopeptide (TPR) repeat protein